MTVFFFFFYWDGFCGHGWLGEGKPHNGVHGILRGMGGTKCRGDG